MTLGMGEIVTYFDDVVRSQGLPSYMTTKYVGRKKIKKLFYEKSV